MSKIFNGIKRFGTGGITVGCVTLDAAMLPLIPLTLWVITGVYVPVAASGLSTAQAWGIAVIIGIFMLISLAVHSVAHNALSGKDSLKRIFLSPLGDPAQIQAPRSTPGREAIAALAGPAAQIILAALFYLLWNLQIDPYITLPAAFLIFYNLGLGALNLTPVFPFDGGRLFRAAMRGIAGKPEAGTKLAVKVGWGFCVFLTGWSIFLLVQEDRFSLATAGATLFIALLIVISLLLYRNRNGNQPEEPEPPVKWRTILAAITMLPLLAVTVSLLPLNQGMEAPGFTAPVAPMVDLPEEYRTTSKGSFILVTVFPQAPILFGEWVYAHFDPAIKLTEQERIVGEDESLQSNALRNYGMLLDSETTAKIVGLQLAGYPAQAVNAGVRIDSIIDESPAIEIIKPDDIITKVNGVPVKTPADLTAILQALTEKTVLKIEIQRAGETLLLDVPTMEPQAGSVKIGIRIAAYITGYDLAFPVVITPKKVTGGPSAGLMFTLTIYDLLTEKDLTRGYKIAGTGTIDLLGSVGAIGGVQQKAAAAERAGAEYFLVPAENFTDAASAAEAGGMRIKVIPVNTAQEAIAFLESLPEK